MKKLTAIILLCVTILLTGCFLIPEEPNTSVPETTDVTLTINQSEDGDVVYCIGTEMDPHFFSMNVGRKGENENGAWECRAEDWAIVEERVAAMGLKRIRVMLLPSWYVISEDNIEVGVYDWNSETMQSLYKTLDLAKANGMDVNITMWGIDTGSAAFMRNDYSSDWVTTPKAGMEELFMTCFADCIKYLIEEKGYTCINEVTLYNEPNALYVGNSAHEEYAELCRIMHGVFQDKGIRDKVKFNLSDDARDPIWMAKTLIDLEGIVDVVNSHSYVFGDSYDIDTNTSNRDMSNEDICYNIANYNLAIWKEMREGYEDIPHIWGEFGTQNGIGSHQTLDKYSPERGLDIARITLNFFNMGSVGASYWVAFSQYYGKNDANIMDMGLWGFADEGYACRPVFYSYSMITRFIRKGDTIYPITSDDGYIVGVAFGNGDEWSYCVVNNGDEAKEVSFVNMAGLPESLNRYVYDEANVPTDNKVIASNGTVEADGRVLTDTVEGRTFVIYTNR